MIHFHSAANNSILARLLKKITQKNPGLCVITSREPLRGFQTNKGKVLQINLEQISAEAGRALMRVGGVHGSDFELENISQNFGNNALAINLLASFIQQTPMQRASNASLVGDLIISDAQGRHPRRVMETIAQQLGPGPELDLLHMLGLFQGSARFAELYYLADEWEIIDGLNNHIHNLDEDAWNEIVFRLRQLNFIAPEIPDKPAVLDTHPLVREHFGLRLKQINEEAWRLGHFVLFSYFVNNWVNYSDRRDFDKIVYRAFKHGCLANRYWDAMEELYIPVIRKLGTKTTPGAILSALSQLYETPWEKLNFIIDCKYKGMATYDTGVALSSLGRLIEATEVMETSFHAFLDADEEDNAATASYKLSWIYLHRGDFKKAIESSRKALEIADEDEEPGTYIRSLSALAYGYHCSGQFVDALQTFQQAESVAIKNNNFRYSHLFYDDFLYCNLLMDMGKFEEANRRLQATKKLLDDRIYDLLVTGEAKLAWGRISVLANSANRQALEVKDYFNMAIEDFQRNGCLVDLSRALIERARFHRIIGELAAAIEDLDEAHDLLRPHHLPLHECMLHLECSRLILKLNSSNYTMLNAPIESYEILTTHDAFNRQAEAAYDHACYAQNIIDQIGYLKLSAEAKILEAACRFHQGLQNDARQAIFQAKEIVNQQGCLMYLKDIEELENMIANKDSEY